MDEIVLRSMLKWPDVPAVYGWLSLDRRGNWMIKTVAGRFERIAHAAVREFIGRNYASDPEGRWYFQNGPQRVFVALDYTPWVYRLDDAGQGLLVDVKIDGRTVTVKGPKGQLSRTFHPNVNIAREDGKLSVSRGDETQTTRALHGLTRTLVANMVAGVTAGFTKDLEISGTGYRAVLQGKKLPIASICAADVPGRFGFVARPAPRAGEPEC